MYAEEDEYQYRTYIWVGLSLSVFQNADNVFSQFANSSLSLNFLNKFRNESFLFWGKISSKVDLFSHKFGDLSQTLFEKDVNCQVAAVISSCDLIYGI